MNRLADAVILAWGWRRRGIAFGAGALSALAQPPFFAFPILWLTFPVLVWLLDGAVEHRPGGRVRRFFPAFRTGWWFGFGYFLAGLWWIGSAFLVEAEAFGWLMPLAVLALPAGLALFWGLGAAAAQLGWSEDWRRIFALATGLGGAEWLRGHVLTGFPWNALGYSLTGGEVLMQSSALLGVYALTVLAILVFAAPATLGAGGRRGTLVLPVLALAVVAGLAVFGLLRLHGNPPAVLAETRVRIVQPALEQGEKWNPANRDEVLRTYLELSASEASPLAPGTLLVWPETAFPFPLTGDPGVLAAIGALLPPQTALATGSFRVEGAGTAEPSVFNSLYVVDDTGTIQGSYDKTHLVPFGEYLPLGSMFDVLGLKYLVEMPGGFMPATRRRLLPSLVGPVFAPLICYEIIFPGEAVPDGERPGFLLNVTNDGWFGRTTGPYQHFHQARVRAVEEGLPLVRAANTGISAVTDPFGRVLARSRLGDVATLDAVLPQALAAAPFRALREFAFLVLFAVCVAVPLTRLFTVRGKEN